MQRQGNPMPAIFGKGSADANLSDQDVRSIIAEAVAAFDAGGKRVLVIIPDGTRTAPVPLVFRIIQESLYRRATSLDYLIALGTHQPMDETAIDALVGMTAAERIARYPGTRIYNHQWDDPLAIATIGVLGRREIEGLSEGHLSLEVPVQINRLALDYDRIIVFGPVFPHEVVGFSGGAKYFFPGISGPDMINVTHWLGALITCGAVIGRDDTPVRRMIEAAVSRIATPVLYCCGVVLHGAMAGIFAGTGTGPWREAVNLSERVHVTFVKKPFRRVLSIMPEMYDDIWTAAKGMYKLEPVVADGGEVIIYAPHITEFSCTHGEVIEKIGYHVRDYFVQQWDRFRKYPWSVLAHSTHLRGAGTFIDGVEATRIRVTLATRISEARCCKAGLGYLDPDSKAVQQLMESPSSDELVVPRAGETLYRLAD
jgi:nickel-dependent lactate racemase